MKRNTFMKRLAVTALAATMTFGTVPMTAVSALADNAVTSPAVDDDKKDTKQYVIDQALKDATVKAVKVKSDSTMSVTDPSTTAAAGDGQLGALATAINNLTGKYQVSNIKITGKASDVAWDADEDKITAPVLNLTADVTKDGKPDATVSFTLDATELTVPEEVQAAKLIIENTGAQDGLDDATYVNEDNETSLKDKVKALLSSDKAAWNGLASEDGVTVDSVTIANRTDATKSAAGSLTLSVVVKKDYKGTKDKSTDTEAQTKTASATASYTATIKKLAINSEDASYQEKINAALQGLTFTNDDFENEDAGAIQKVKDALNNVGLKEFADGSGITFRAEKDATHKANGSVSVLLDAKRDGDSDLQYYDAVKCVVEHSQDDIKAEVEKALNDAQSDLQKNSRGIQAKNATKAATKAQVVSGLKTAIDAKLADTLGGTNTIASEITGYDVEIVDYKESTADVNGSLTYKVTVTYKGTVTGQENDDHEITYNYTKAVELEKLKKVDATGIALDEQYSVIPNGEVEITPDFTPEDANQYTVKWTLDKDDADYGKFSLENVDDKGTTENAPVKVKTTASIGDSIKLTAQLIDEDKLVVATATTTVKVEKGFNDVQNPSAYYYAAVYSLKNREVVSGTTDTTFEPGKSLTRAEFVQMLYNAAKNVYHKENATGVKDPADVKAKDTFSDVSKEAWYAKAVTWAVENNITAGKTSTTFDPNGVVTRAEAVQFMNNMLASGETYNAKTPFTDVADTAWYANAVNWAVNEDITAGKTPTTFAPKDTCNRAQAAVLIYNAYRSGVIYNFYA